MRAERQTIRPTGLEPAAADDGTTARTAVAGAQDAIRRADGKAAAIATLQASIATTAYAHVEGVPTIVEAYPVAAWIAGPALVGGLLASFCLLGLVFWPRLAGADPLNRLAFPHLADRARQPGPAAVGAEAWDLAVALSVIARRKFRLIRWTLGAALCSTTAFVAWLFLSGLSQ